MRQSSPPTRYQGPSESRSTQDLFPSFGVRSLSLRFLSSGFGFQISEFGNRVSGFRVWGSDLRFRSSGFGVQVSGLGVRVSVETFFFGFQISDSGVAVCYEEIRTSGKGGLVSSDKKRFWVGSGREHRISDLEFWD